MNNLIEAPEVPANIADIASKEGLKPFLDYAVAIAEEAKAEVNDATTDKGRKAIGSLAAKVSTSKTAISKPGAELVKELKQAGVDAQKLFKDFSDKMDSIRDDIKKPVDEWKAEEKARIDSLHARIDFIGHLTAKACADTGTVYTASELSGKRAELSSLEFDADEFGELHQQAMETWSQALDHLDASIKERTEYEAAIAESERLKAELAEREKQAEIEKAAADAKAKAEQDAANKIAEANAKAERAEEDARQKVLDEQRAAEVVERLQKEAEAKRAADTEHQRSVNNKTMNELMQCCSGLTDKQAKLIITNLVNGKFSHITINY